MTQANPFSFLKETQNYPYARIKRSNLSERLSDTWHIMAGRISPLSIKSWTDVVGYTSYIGVNSPILQSFGIVDYLSVGIFPLLDVILKACDIYIQNRKCKSQIAVLKNGKFIFTPSPSVTNFLNWFLILIRTIINLIRHLIALALTLVVVPLVLMAHSILMLISPPTFRNKIKIDKDSYPTKFDVNDIILVDEFPQQEIIPFALYVKNQSGAIDWAGCYHENRLGNIKFNNMLFSSINLDCDSNVADCKEQFIEKLNTRSYDISFTENDLLENEIISWLNMTSTAKEYAVSLRLYGCNRLQHHQDGQKLYLSLIYQDQHGTDGAESSDVRRLWKIDPNDKTIMQHIKNFIEFNVFGITAALENNNQYQFLEEQFCKLNIETSRAIQNKI